jgi:hypothetical protein
MDQCKFRHWYCSFGYQYCRVQCPMLSNVRSTCKAQDRPSPHLQDPQSANRIVPQWVFRCGSERWPKSNRQHPVLWECSSWHPNQRLLNLNSCRRTATEQSHDDDSQHRHGNSKPYSMGRIASSPVAGDGYRNPPATLFAIRRLQLQLQLQLQLH